MLTRKRTFAALFLTLIWTPLSLGNEPLRPRSHLDLPQEHITVEDGMPIQGITEDSFAYVDYEAIRRDFPEIAHLENRQILKWLSNQIVIGSRQHKLNGIRHTPILRDETRPTQKIYRPGSWIRSGVLAIKDLSGRVIGMIDGKGIGHGAASREVPRQTVEGQVEEYEKVKSNPADLDKLRTQPYSDGVATLGETVAEAIRQKVVQKLFEYRGVSLETVETYAVLKLPFDILKNGSHKESAGLYLRQAHIGRGSNLPVPSTIYFDNEGNKQRSGSHSAVDFGAVEVTDPLVAEIFGDTKGTVQSSRIWALSHEAARDFVNGDFDAVNRLMRKVLALIPEPSPAVLRARAQDRKAFKDEALEKLKAGKSMQDTVYESKVPKSVILLALKDKDVTVRERASKDIPPDPELIETALRDPSETVREYAAKALAGCKGSRCLELFKLGLSDSNKFVVHNSGLALSSRELPERMKLVEYALSLPNSKARDVVTRYFKGAIGKEGQRVMEIALKDSDYDVASGAASRMKEVTDVDHQKLVETALKNENWIVRREAIYLLDQIKLKDPNRLIDMALQDPHAEIRKGAEFVRSRICGQSFSGQN